MKVWLYFVVSSMLIGWCRAGKAEPAIGFMKRAYCACVCCEDKSDECFRHPSIEDGFQCVQNDCTEEFCVRWHEAKCESTCYCEKCQQYTRPDDYQCQFHQGIPDDCECGDMDKIECEIDEDYEAIRKAKKDFEKMKSLSHCLVPCYCEKCKDIPGQFSGKCEEAGPPPEECSCKNTVCPTKEQLVQFQKILESEEKGLTLTKKAIAERWSNKADDAEVDSINQKLKPAIDAGVVSPMTKSTLFSIKCNMQCMCDSCKWNSPDMEQTCNKVIVKRLQGCPECPENIQCPEENAEATCKMYCFCLRCKGDKRMPDRVKHKCEEVMTMTTEICPCEEEVDCNILGQMEQLQKQQATATHTYVTSEDGKPRPGKMKAKHKMWDEL